MKAIKFRLLFEGHQNELETHTFEVSADGIPVQFKISDLVDINKLRETKSQQEFESLYNYFAFPDFSLYYLEVYDILFIVGYRAVKEKHELYERGFVKMEKEVQ